MGYMNKIMDYVKIGAVAVTLAAASLSGSYKSTIDSKIDKLDYKMDTLEAVAYETGNNLVLPGLECDNVLECIDCSGPGQI